MSTGSVPEQIRFVGADGLTNAEEREHDGEERHDGDRRVVLVCLTDEGRRLWIYHDTARNTWRLQGEWA